MMKPTVDLKIQISQIDTAIEELKAEKTRLESLLNENLEQNKLERLSAYSRQITMMLEMHEGLEYSETFQKFDYFDKDGRFVFTYKVKLSDEEDLVKILSKINDAILAHRILSSHFDFDRFTIIKSDDDRDSYHIFSNQDEVNVRLKFACGSKIDVTVFRSFGVNEYLHLLTHLTDTTSIAVRPSSEATVEIEDNQTIDLISDLDTRFDQMIENVNQYRISYDHQD